MNRITKHIVAGMFACIMVLSLMIAPAAALNQRLTCVDNETIAVSELLTDSVISQLAVLNLESAVPASTNINVKFIEDTVFDREVRRVEFETFQVDIDQTGAVVSVLNYADLHDTDSSIIGGDNENLSAYTVKEVEAMALADRIVSEYELDGYELVECTNEIPAVWILTWNKRLAENVLNPYDVMTVTVDARDCSVMSMKRNTVTPAETIPELTEEEALLKTMDIQNELGNPGVSSVALTVFRPNYYWDYLTATEIIAANDSAETVRLAWCITLEDLSTIYVDARSGEIIGGYRTLSARARAVSAVPEFFESQVCVNLAYEGLQRLGYSHHLNTVNYHITQADIEYIINGSDLKGLYLTCHGGVTCGIGILTDNEDVSKSSWLMSTNIINGNYNFVFLDACLSSSIDAFPNAFLGGERIGKCFVGWNVSVPDDTSFYFNTLFWPKVGNMTILDAVLYARENSIAQGHAYCNPGFSGDSSCYGRA